MPERPGCRRVLPAARGLLEDIGITALCKWSRACAGAPAPAPLATAQPLPLPTRLPRCFSSPSHLPPLQGRARPSFWRLPFRSWLGFLLQNFRSCSHVPCSHEVPLSRSRRPALGWSDSVLSFHRALATCDFIPLRALLECKLRAETVSHGVTVVSPKKELGMEGMRSTYLLNEE